MAAAEGTAPAFLGYLAIMDRKLWLLVFFGGIAQCKRVRMCTLVLCTQCFVVVCFDYRLLWLSWPGIEQAVLASCLPSVLSSDATLAAAWLV